ncbi:ParA family protein [Dermabacter hominis]
MRQLRNDMELRKRLEKATFAAPEHTRIMAVANQKGGVGKTSSAVNVAVALAKGGLNVLVIDSDPQGNASTALGIPHDPEIASLYDVLIEDEPLSAIVTPSPESDTLECAPATIDLSGAEIELVPMVARESRLKNALADYFEEREQKGLPRLDYVLIDCPPSLGLLTINALVAAREVFMPIQAEYYALEGIAMLWKNIDLIRKHLNPDLVVSTILLTMYDARTRLAAQVAEDVRAHFPTQTLDTVIPRSVRISEAPSYAQTVLNYDPNSTGALAYRAAAHEISRRPEPKN